MLQNKRKMSDYISKEKFYKLYIIDLDFSSHQDLNILRSL